MDLNWNSTKVSIVQGLEDLTYGCEEQLLCISSISLLSASSLHQWENNSGLTTEEFNRWKWSIILYLFCNFCNSKLFSPPPPPPPLFTGQFAKRKKTSLWFTVSLLVVSIFILTIGLAATTRTENVTVGGYYPGIIVSKETYWITISAGYRKL